MLGGMAVQHQNQRAQQPKANKFAAATAVSTAHDNSPHRTILTGESNVGKTWFVSTVEGMFIMPIERGLKGANPRCHPGKYTVVPDSFEEVIQGMIHFRDVLNARQAPPAGATDAKPRRPYKHFAIDGFAGLEKWVNRAACGKENVDHMEAKEYRKVWSAAQPLWEQIQDVLDSIWETGVNIWIIGHSGDAYDSAQTGSDAGESFKVKDLSFRGSGKPLDEVRLLWRGWADNVFYLMQTMKIRKGSKGRRTIAETQGRILVTVDTGLIKAKHRGLLPPQVNATWEDLKKAWMAGYPAKPEKMRAQVEEIAAKLLEEDGKTILAELAQHGEDAVKLATLLSRAQGMAALLADERGESEEDEEGGQEGEGDNGAPPGAPEQSAPSETPAAAA